jgi:hypothetical protein
LIPGCGDAADDAQEYAAVPSEISYWLPEGEFDVLHLDSIAASGRRRELMERFIAAMRANPDLARSATPLGESLEYDPRLGLSEVEWEELKEMQKDLSDLWLLPSDSTRVRIGRRGDTITFTGDGIFLPLSTLTIDLQTNDVMFTGYRLPYRTAYTVDDTNNALHSRSRGHTWIFRTPDSLLRKHSPRDVSTIWLRVYTISIGRLERDSSVFIEVSGFESKDGVTTVNYRLPYKVRVAVGDRSPRNGSFL